MGRRVTVVSSGGGDCVSCAAAVRGKMQIANCKMQIANWGRNADFAVRSLREPAGLSRRDKPGGSLGLSATARRAVGAQPVGGGAFMRARVDLGLNDEIRPASLPDEKLAHAARGRAEACNGCPRAIRKAKRGRQL